MHHVDKVSDVTPIPVGSRLLHIGPAKTGTTTLQGALHTCRSEMAEYGVEYAGKRRHSRSAIAGIAYTNPPKFYPPDVAKRWKRLAAQVRRSDADRIVLSSETLARIQPGQARTLVSDIGGNVSLVLTMRPLAAILASRWQQSVQDEYTRGYPEWLANIFGENGRRKTNPGFWLRYDLARHIKRWGPIVGEENITFVILDPADRGMLLGAFEGLLGLPSGLLVPDASLTNPSLPHPEIEMIAAFNQAFRAHGHSRKEFVHAIRGKAMVDFKADPEALKLGRIRTPRWAAEGANQAAMPWIEAVAASRAQVIGNLEHLLVDPQDYPSDPVSPTSLSTGNAGELAFRLYRAGLVYGERAGRQAAEREAATAREASVVSARPNVVRDAMTKTTAKVSSKVPAGLKRRLDSLRR